MKKEKIVLSFVAVLIGILVAGVAFYFYQEGKTIPTSETNSKAKIQPSPTPKSTIFLALETPENEAVFDKKTIKVAGKTVPEATIIISTDTQDQVVTPASSGSFSTTTTIGDDQNIIVITAIAPNGDEQQLTRTITFSTENF